MDPMEIQNESIFVSSLRGFFRSLFVWLGIFVAIAIALIVIFSLSSPYQAEEKTKLELIPDLEGKRALAPLNSPAILRINIHGVIGEPEHLDSESIEWVLLDSQEGLLQHNRVKGVLLHFDTPGGTVVDSDNIYRLILKYKKKYNVPVYGYVDGLCASGGMYIASSVDRLYCGHASIVGSIGIIIGPFFNVSDAISRIGIEARSLTQGIDKDMMNPFRPWKIDEDENLKQSMTHFYQQFVTVVTTGRPQINRTKLVEEYGAKIFDGPAALERGYVDVADSDYETALSDLMKEAKIDPAKPYQVVQLLPKRNIWSEIMQGRSLLLNGQIEHKLQIGSDHTSFIKDQFAYLYQPHG
jgi:signal peptide peptidase SppA